ncbi:MAG: putative metal-dependent phosphoesterase TrpH, contains PHP domain [Candidatus Electronema aureum]|uniref:Metal-dependent phosphoesterase TrpH, contains PHP domain n=1 Tax=Candidatus Electronema aureum TaxID=2005002 RepID=A0A521G434_9BACT|nr:MAG: putative metal-dependent phosphoesterase TrpH, contains PHP domain [Candidatus Electronema aureum]
MQKSYSKLGISVFAGACMGIFGATAPALASYNVYYGHLHNHSNVSDGSGTPAQAYAYARDTAGLDFFSLADHDSGISSTEWTTIKNTANTYNSDGNFVALWGFEWSSGGNYGHVTVIGTDDYCSAGSTATDTFTELVTWLNARSGVAFFNHPGREDGQSREFSHFTTAPSDKFVGMELFNKADDFDTYYYNDGYYTNDGSKSFFDEAISRGWDIGAAGGDDNHTATWGTDTDYRLAVLATAKTRTAIMEAMQARRMFSTLDKNLTLSFTLSSAEMGSVLDPATHALRIEANDGNGEVFSTVQLIKNGAVAQTWNPNQAHPIITGSVTAAEGDYYYVKVTQQDGGEAISSPITMTGTAGGGSSTVSARVATGSDDAEQRQTGGVVTLNSSDLELVYDSSTTGNQYVGMRFANLGIPQGATITNAYIQFTVDETNSGTTSLTIKGQAADNAATFTTASNNISSRATTTASVAWTPVAWSTVGQAGAGQQTPDLKDIVQEIVNRTGWSANNGMAIIITGTGERTAEAYEGSASQAAQLVVTYE